MMTDARRNPDRACWLVLVAAMIGAAAVILWLDRGTTYNVDQIRFFLADPVRDLEALLEPQNGNLLLTTTLAYKVLLGSIGADFLPFRLIHVAVLLIATALLFALVKRRIGPVAALAPTLVLLFFGSDWGHVGTALGFTVLSSVAAGLGALLLLERGDRIGDAGACALLVVSVASFSTGLAFLIGVGISVLLAPDRWRRAWIWALPFALYLAWWLWARGTEVTSQDPQLSDLLLAPDYAFTSLSAVLASLTGLNYEFPPQIPPNLISPGPGAALAAVAIVLLVVRIKRGAVPAALWVGLGIVLSYWTLGSLVVEGGGGFRDPTKTRYMYPGAVMVSLVAAAAVAGWRPSRRGVIVLFAVAATGLAANLILLRDGVNWFRSEYSPRAKAQFAMLELARERVDPAYDPRYGVPDESVVSTPAGAYLAAAARYGSPGFALAELAREPEAIRVVADRILAGALEIQLQPAARSGAGSDRCRRTSRAGESIALELPASGATVSVRSRAGGAVSLGRFSDAYPVELAGLEPAATARLEVPGDASSIPWRLLATGPGPIELCVET